MKKYGYGFIRFFWLTWLLLSLLQTQDSWAQGSSSAQKLPAVYEFGAKSCVPCIQMQQVMAELKASHGDKVEFRMVYVDEDRELFSRYRIMLIPTQVFLNAEGKEVDRHIGALSKEELLRKLKALQLIN